MDKDRRRYFRIDDSIILNYRVVPQMEFEQAIERRRSGRYPQLDTQHALEALNRRIEEEMTLLTNVDARVVNAVDLINRKLDLVVRMVKVGDNSYIDQPTRLVNLSAGGVAFRAGMSLTEGTYVELQMVLFPTYDYITPLGVVVKSRVVQGGDPAYPYQIAVEFESLDEESQDLIAQHVMKKHSAKLQARRGNSDSDPSWVQDDSDELDDFRKR